MVQNIEQNQFEAICEIEQLYGKKLQFESEKYLALEAAILEKEIRHGQRFAALQGMHQDTVQSLMNDFSRKLEQARAVFFSTSDTAQQLRTVFEQRLDEHELDHESELAELKDWDLGNMDALRLQLEELRRKNYNVKMENKVSNEEKDKVLRLYLLYLGSPRSARESRRTPSS